MSQQVHNLLLIFGSVGSPKEIYLFNTADTYCGGECNSLEAEKISRVMARNLVQLQPSQFSKTPSNFLTTKLQLFTLFD
jgi:hypothetical protein